jgi:hypothetical protein
MLVQQGLQAGLPGGGQQGVAATLMGSRLQGSALLEVLPDAAHCRHAIIQNGGNLLCAMALVIEVDDSLAHGYRYRFHSHRLLQPPVIRYMFYGNALSRNDAIKQRLSKEAAAPWALNACD